MAETVSEATHQRITAAAVDAIRGNPVLTLNVQDIAETADVSTSAIYKAYGNKYELFAEASRVILMEQAEAILAHVDADAEPIDRLHQLLAGIFHIGREEPFAAAYVFCTFPMVYHGDVDQSVGDRARDLRRYLVDGLRNHIGDAIEAGELEGDADTLAELVAIDTFGYVGRSITVSERVGPDAFAPVHDRRFAQLRSAVTVRYTARMRLLRALCSTSANPSASSTGGT
ncbi:MAG: TetR/AcrR family transcriptional regulator [Actinomycetota bacterium]